MNWMCEKLALPDPGIRPAPDVAAITREAAEYLEHVLERWRRPLRDVPDDKLERPEYSIGMADALLYRCDVGACCHASHPPPLSVG